MDNDEKTTPVHKMHGKAKQFCDLFITGLHQIIRQNFLTHGHQSIAVTIRKHNEGVTHFSESEENVMKLIWRRFCHFFDFECPMVILTENPIFVQLDSKCGHYRLHLKSYKVVLCCTLCSDVTVLCTLHCGPL